MTEELQQAIESLRQITPKLNAATDKAARIVTEVDKLLGDELSIGISAAEVFDSYNRRVLRDEEHSEKTVAVQDVSCLAYRRDAHGTFRLLVEICRMWPTGDGDEEEELLEEYPWASAPRKLKLQSFAVLPMLLKAIADEAAESVKAAEAASDLVEQLTKALPKK